MNGKEKLIEALKNIDIKELAEPRPVFSEAEYALFKKSNLTAQEIKDLEDAEMLSQIVELLPTDDAGKTRLAQALDALSRTDSKENIANLLTIAQKDPNTLLQLLALSEIAE